jgi:hypothetical protein
MVKSEAYQTIFIDESGNRVGNKDRKYQQYSHDTSVGIADVRTDRRDSQEADRKVDKEDISTELLWGKNKTRCANDQKCPSEQFYLKRNQHNPAERKKDNAYYL